MASEIDHGLLGAQLAKSRFPFARHVFFLGRGGVQFGQELSGHETAHAIDVNQVEIDGPPSLVKQAAPFDWVVLSPIPMDEPALERTIAGLAEHCSEYCYYNLVALDSGDNAYSEERLNALLDRCGLSPYITMPLLAERSGGPRGNGERFGYIQCAVRKNYNPIVHARDLFSRRLPYAAFQVLMYIPESLLADPMVRAQVCTDRQLYLLAWDTVADPATQSERFFNSQVLFYEAVCHAPHVPGPYMCHARFWERIGNPEMARRLLRSAKRIAPSDAYDGVLNPNVQQTVRTVCAEPPPYSLPERPPRVLYFMNTRPHYGLDVLYDGLCNVLGDRNVVEYPWKGSLHGEMPGELAHYPCLFKRRGAPIDSEVILQELRGGRFDLVLFGDIEGSANADDARRISDAAGDIPFYIVDEMDDPGDHTDQILERIGERPVAGYFKREMLTCIQYAPDTYPLPFAYADRNVPEQLEIKRPEFLFWAGHRQFGLRRPYLEMVEQLLETRYDKKYDQSEYMRALQTSLVGLNIFGFGYDTVRYWEVPAHGCMLLSERLPIYIPYNFRDGESAVYFDDIDDLEEKLTYYRDHKDEARAIALRGHDWLKEHHTGSARARQMLGWIQSG